MSEDATLSFAEFIGTGRSTHDIGGVINDDALVNISGRVYLGRLYIEVETGGGVILTIGNHVSTDRKTVERELYDWACSEGHCEIQWIAESIAWHFVRGLIFDAGLEPSQFTEIRERTAEMCNDSCATHDFCDANVYMARAVEAAGFTTDNLSIWLLAWNAAVALYMDEDRVAEMVRIG